MKKVKHARKENKSIQYATFALGVIAVGLLVYMIAFPPPLPPEPPVTPVPTATPGVVETPAGEAVHSVEEAKEYLSRVMASYRDLIYAEVPTPEYNPCTKTWDATLKISGAGLTQNVYVRLNDDPVLTLNSTYVETNKPYWITENKVITNGTIKIFGKIPCTPEAGCGNKTCVWLFTDPYCPNCILAEDNVNAFLAEHNDSVEYSYRVLMSTSQAMLDHYGKLEVERISKYFLCAQKQGLLSPLKDCAILKYRMKGVEAPLTKEELDACLPEGLEMDEFDSCVETVYTDIDWDRKVALTYNVTETPMALIDCQYRVHPTYLEHGFCYLYPDENCD
jgi:hypothetical protein